MFLNGLKMVLKLKIFLFVFFIISDCYGIDIFGIFIRSMMDIDWYNVNYDLLFFYIEI